MHTVNHKSFWIRTDSLAEVFPCFTNTLSHTWIQNEINAVCVRNHDTVDFFHSCLFCRHRFHSTFGCWPYWFHSAAETCWTLQLRFKNRHVFECLHRLSAVFYLPFESQCGHLLADWTGAPGPSFLLDSLFHIIKLFRPEEGAAAPCTVAFILSNCQHSDHKC